MNLQGTWRFCLDREDIGIKEKWYLRELENNIRVSGSLQEQGYGDEITAETPLIDGLHDKLWFLREEMCDFSKDEKVRIPFLSQPVRHYTGAAWFQRDIEIKKEWGRKKQKLFMELVHWKSSVWVDDVFYGDFDSLCVPHIFPLGYLCAGKHVLTVRVDNRMLFPYRPDAHGVSDSVGHTWNGIAGRVELLQEDELSFQKIEVFPDYASKSAKIKIGIQNDGCAETVCISINLCINANREDIGDAQSIMPKMREFCLKGKAESGESELEYSIPLGEAARCWDEFTPVLQKLKLGLQRENGEITDRKNVTFGLRNPVASGRKILLNGRVCHFRGTHDGGCFPLTGYPAYEEKDWKRIFGICKEWGLNHVRFHSWCPPEAAFQAADEMGIYLQIETGMWNYFLKGGEMEQQLWLETERILDTFGNHPSFLMLSSGNEPHGEYKPVVKEWVEKCRKRDNRHLYCAQSGWLWPQPPEELNATDYFYTCSRYNTSKMRGREGWFGKDYNKYLEDLEAPFLSHELGQYCAYPDFRIIDKFTGYLRPGNLEVFRSLAARHGLLKWNKDFVKASGRLQFLAYKEEIEANYRTSGFSGFSLLDLHDYLGQGGALVGFLDAFWDKKSYANAKDFRHFCAPVVPLLRMRKVNYRTDEMFEAELEVACYTKEEKLETNVLWTVRNSCEKTVLQGVFPKVTILSGGNTYIGKMDFALKQLSAPDSYVLTVELEGTGIENSWKLWVFPEAGMPVVSPEIGIAKTLSAVRKLLREGKKVLFLVQPENLQYNSPQLSGIPVFWNGRMGPKWSRNLGMWCDVSHGALKEFPTEEEMEWQWEEVFDGARGINMEGLPGELRPFLQPIDDWNRSYPLALAFEAKLNGGKILVCSADLQNNLADRPAAEQLLHSFLNYMGSAEFQPDVVVTEEQMKTFMADTSIMRRLHAEVSVKSSFKDIAAEENPVSNLLDGDPNTYWLAGGIYGGSYPFELEFKVENPVKIKGLQIVPRQNHRDYEGQIKTYAVYGEEKGKWNEICKGKLKASFDPQKILFPKEVELQKLRLCLLDGFGAKNLFYWKEQKGFFSKQEDYMDQCASLAEVDFICGKFESEEENAVSYRQGKTASKEIY